jgi:ABC-type cobalamin transport system ATPase subunit
VNEIPQPDENYWGSARHILHFVGICGAGKSTLCARIADHCRGAGAKVIGTIDYDPHTRP